MKTTSLRQNEKNITLIFFMQKLLKINNTILKDEIPQKFLFFIYKSVISYYIYYLLYLICNKYT